MSEYGQQVPDVDNDDVPEVANDNSPENALNPDDPELPALPGDKPLGIDAQGTTADEQSEGESLDDKLAREQG
ncbi:MAG: hypothetical protein QOE40_1451 [Actinomycetota bacterium]|nr:hypothetical protein [Actinomycetota bacterium]